MIIYNNRYRGPHEYDKFALNILSFHNAVESIRTSEVNGIADDMLTLKSIHEDVNSVFDIYSKNNGLCENIFLLTIKERECIKRWYRWWQVTNLMKY